MKLKQSNQHRPGYKPGGGLTCVSSVLYWELDSWPLLICSLACDMIMLMLLSLSSWRSSACDRMSVSPDRRRLSLGSSSATIRHINYRSYGEHYEEFKRNSRNFLSCWKTATKTTFGGNSPQHADFTLRASLLSTKQNCKYKNNHGFQLPLDLPKRWGLPSRSNFPAGPGFFP